MATYSNIGIELITTGDESGTWGDTTNTNFSDILDEAIAGAVTYNIASDADVTLTVSDGSSSDARHAVINFTSTTLSATRTVTFAPDTLQKTWLVINSTTGGQSLTFKQGSAGATVTVPNGESAIIYSDGAGATNGAITKALDSFTNTKITTSTLNATTLDLTNLEVTNVKAKDGTAAFTIADSTGKVTVSSELAVDNLNLSGNAITSTNSNGNIDLTPNGSGEVNITKVDIDAGTIDGTTIATSDITVGAGKTLNVSAGTLTLANDQISGNSVEGGTINAITINTLTSTTVNGTTFDTNVADAAVTLSGVTLAADGTNTNIDINITPKGTGEVNLTKVDIDGGAIDGTAIGVNTASTGAFTTLITSSGSTLNGGVVINEPGADVDFRVEGDTDSNLLFVDASTDRVGFGTNTPGALLDVDGDALISGLTVGKGAGAISTNTAVGNEALDANTTGNNNTANGYQSLYLNTTGSGNTANGLEALYSNTIGSGNTAVGYEALYSNTTGNNNTAVGYFALFDNTTGSSNIAIGRSALENNTTGSGNTANGRNALLSNTTGGNNTAVGYEALRSNTTGNDNTANGVNALYSNTTGASNTANGRNALLANTTGNFNTATGRDALYNNTTGIQNTANGYTALYSNTTGNLNTANGYQALYSNTTGSNNTASGREAIYSNTTGNDNTANGIQALYLNTTGSLNTANGVNALYNNTTGIQNTANGYAALYSNTTGDYNTANGVTALYLNTTGSSNTANGLNALYSNTTGNENTALGVEAGYGDGSQANTTGSNNTFVGYDAMGASSTASNVITLGNSSIATLRCQVTTITSLSDERDKKNIAQLSAGLDFVSRLNPVSFDWNTRDGKKVGIADAGFIAQELLAVQSATGITIPNLVSQENPDKLEAGYGTLIPVLVKAIQELNAKVEALQSEIATLKGN